MSDNAIRIEHLSKYYRLGVINNGMLYKDIQSWMARKLGRPDPHAEIGRDRYSDAEDGFWALKDLTLDVKHGDRLAIIGRNGAGKSTLLKILSRITAPTEGTAKIRGRVASLLEVGTGFHSELTGRENVYLNGAIMGMKKYEIARKMDEIVDFSGIENHIDTPVKRYSSGMYVRLAFSVAAHLDSDILLADEVLAVGDASFQKKALGKMQSLSAEGGRTVLFVSHNMGAVKQLCNRGVILDKGRLLQGDEEITKVVKRYLSEGSSPKKDPLEWVDDGALAFSEFSLERMAGRESDGRPVRFPISAEKDYCIELDFSVSERNPYLVFELMVLSEEEIEVFRTSPFYSLPNYIPNLGKNKLRCTIPKNLLNDREYRIELRASLYMIKWILEPGKNAPFIRFRVDQRVNYSPFTNVDPGQIAPFLSWSAC